MSTPGHKIWCEVMGRIAQNDSARPFCLHYGHYKIWREHWELEIIYIHKNGAWKIVVITSSIENGWSDVAQFVLRCSYLLGEGF